MPYYKKTIISGSVKEVEVYQSKRVVGKRIPRCKNKNSTDAEQLLINFKNAIKKLCRLINANFKPTDLFLTLTYEIEPSYEQANRELKNFLERIRDWGKRNGKEIKYVYVTERTDVRIHHHMVMSGIPQDVVDEKWGLGIVIKSRLSKNEDYTGLAHYITKEPAMPHKKRWGQSRNLKKPKVEYTEIRRSTAERKIAEPKGYKTARREIFYTEETGLYQYCKFVRLNALDLSMGRREREEDLEA